MTHVRIRTRGEFMKFVYYYCVIGLAFGLCTQAFGSESFLRTTENQCTSTDVRDSFPLPVRDQGKIDWCYANAAADFLQYTFKIPTQISAADIAINYSKTDFSKLVTFITRVASGNWNMPPDTGLIKTAIKKILPQGYCEESTFPSNAWNRVDTHSQQSFSQEILQSITEIYDLQEQVAHGVIHTEDQLSFYYTFKNVDKSAFFKILKNATHHSILEDLRTAACGSERIPFPRTPIKVSFKFKGFHSIQNINAQLDHHMPVSLDFFAGLFDNIDHFPKSIGDLHTVLIVGRYFDPVTQSCTYRLKNSWGADCSSYPYDPRLNCTGGVLNVPERNLFKAMTSEVSITKGKKL